MHIAPTRLASLATGEESGLIGQKMAVRRTGARDHDVEHGLLHQRTDPRVRFLRKVDTAPALPLAGSAAVPRKFGSRKNRYLLAAFKIGLEQVADASARGGDRDNYRDNPS